MSEELDGIGRSNLLGREFLTWLWARTELDRGRFQIDGESIGLMVDEELVLVDDAEDGGTDILRAGDPAVSDEAGAALRAGKKARQIRWHLAQDNLEWMFTLDERLQFRSLRLPRSPSEHPSDAFGEQLDAIAFVGKVVDELFARFVAVRLSDGWKAETRKLRAWAAAK